MSFIYIKLRNIQMHHIVQALLTDVDQPVLKLLAYIQPTSFLRVHNLWNL